MTKLFVIVVAVLVITNLLLWVLIMGLCAIIKQKIYIERSMKDGKRSGSKKR